MDYLAMYLFGLGNGNFIFLPLICLLMTWMDWVSGSCKHASISRWTREEHSHTHMYRYLVLRQYKYASLALILAERYWVKIWQVMGGREKTPNANLDKRFPLKENASGYYKNTFCTRIYMYIAGVVYSTSHNKEMKSFPAAAKSGGS